MDDILSQIPKDILNFVLVTASSFLIGLEQRRHYLEEEVETQFGTDRTFTLIGITGYLFYVISPANLIPFIAGGIIISGLFSIYYYQKIVIKHLFGMTSLVTALITYCLAPLIYTKPLALPLLLVVVVLVITEIKQNLRDITKKLGKDEFITFAKFLLLAGIILPLLSRNPISPVINISPFKIWLSIVVVSTISYFSYLLRKFVFPDKGILLTGILGGLYSSTATTIILARKSRENSMDNRIIGAIFFANAMMYLRIFMFALFFNTDMALQLLPYFACFFLLCCFIGFFYGIFRGKEETNRNEVITDQDHQNPLEFKTALLFGTMFVLFAIITQQVVVNYGSSGIKILSWIVGVTDIDPFILNLFQGKWDVATPILAIAIINATTSNNILKMGYSLVLGNRSLRKKLFISFGILIAGGIVAALI